MDKQVHQEHNNRIGVFLIVPASQLWLESNWNVLDNTPSEEK